VVFQAGTKSTITGDQILTNGGRVLGVTALHDDPAQARSLAYRAADRIGFDQMQRREDIGQS